MVKSIYWTRMVKSIQIIKSVTQLEKMAIKYILIVMFENEDVKKCHPTAKSAPHYM